MIEPPGAPDSSSLSRRDSGQSQGQATAAYAEAGFRVVAIASRTPARAEAVAGRWSIPVVHATPAALIADSAVEILDLAFPPDCQPALIRAALGEPHIRGILAQKPLAIS